MVVDDQDALWAQDSSRVATPTRRA
jgi:hypothetical protein